MSELYLIRHGQASFGAEDYDVLSPLGEDQSRRLGRYLGRAAGRLDAAFAGPARRHRDTATLALETARELGVDLPTPELAPALDEYPGAELFRRQLPTLAAEEPALAAWASRPAPPASESGDPGAPGERRDLERAGARALARLIKRWVRGELDTGGLETFAEFDARVRRGLDEIMKACGRGKRIAVFTSGGPIGVAVGRALELSPDKIMEVASVVANASITELRYRGSRLGLIALNVAPHLDAPELVTVR